MIARLLRSADFERVLRTRTQASSAHFAVHHVPDRPSAPARPSVTAQAAELSTGEKPELNSAVDDFRVSAPPGLVWLGAVVPKRHAKRAVTRSLLKRQIRCAVLGSEAALADGLWVVRLRSPFDLKQYTSAASDALKEAAREELRALFERAVRGERDRVKPRAPRAAPAKGSSGHAGTPPQASAGGPPCAA